MRGIARGYPIVLLAIIGCGGNEPRERTKTGAAPSEPKEAAAKADTVPEKAHRVVFADRTSQGYLLLLDGPIRPDAPTPDRLVELVDSSFPEHQESDEVRLLKQLIRTRPHSAADAAPRAADEPGTVEATSDPKQDLLGLHIEVIRVDANSIPPAALEDDILLRELEPAERMSLPQRGWALLLRADYRNMNGVRGLRLLQTLVRIVAEREDALIHDPDTLETLGPAAFSRRRLQGSLGNIADQVAVVPFPDPRHEGRLRLTTKGMRRFGSVDLEIDGLPRDPWALQRATDMLYGLALVMIKEGEFDASGFAIELDDTVAVHWRDASRAYAGREGKLPRCDECPEEVLVHLVERPRESQDTHGHVVARVVAPRATSDAAGYDHPAWVAQSLERLFGDPAGE